MNNINIEIIITIESEDIPIPIQIGWINNEVIIPHIVIIMKEKIKRMNGYEIGINFNWSNLNVNIGKMFVEKMNERI
jgi:hypothetical protein